MRQASQEKIDEKIDQDVFVEGGGIVLKFG